MAVSYLERFSLIENVNFHKRIQVAIWTASAVVLVEVVACVTPTDVSLSMEIFRVESLDL